MEKTAVTQLLEWLEADGDLPGFDERYREKVREVLELEKQQLMSAYNYGWRLAVALKEPLPADSEEYYATHYIQS